MTAPGERLTPQQMREEWDALKQVRYPAIHQSTHQLVERVLAAWQADRDEITRLNEVCDTNEMLMRSTSEREDTLRRELQADREALERMERDNTALIEAGKQLGTDWAEANATIVHLRALLRRAREALADAHAPHATYSCTRCKLRATVLAELDAAQGEGSPK